ncbi:PIN-like domain-containing protein [Streptomyces mirabilis]|uniref:PIN-like domain-containing protein n=1 Tax=Streptomyces mirabilis TaxID=68239 RepID=A0ABU3UQM3_9ACTN|nr:PIN-like domain-containing protein [Streptomyces mirabilis]MDU8996214.1 PIN-like domain-containing protein [Streptomyces mirabilis]
MKNDESEPADEGENRKRRGIFDCDDAYRTPTSDDYKRLFETGMIVVDTNVLINLYRSNGRTRRDTFAVLRRLQNQLWVPHQVLSEFWRNRDLPSVKGHHHAKARTACTALDKASRSLSDAADRWLKDVHLDADDAARKRIGGYKASIQRSLDEMKRFIEEQAENDALDGTGSTQTDPVLLKLEPLLLGRIGDPFSPEDYAEAVKEAKRRADKEVPPGYADYDAKPDEQAAGDYIVWKQVIGEAARNGRDVLLVTGDIKEDWWTPRTNQSPARPRSELQNELRNQSGVALFMLTPSQLLAEVSTAFKLEVDKRSVNDLASREGNVEIFPAPIRSAIVGSILSAHERAREVHKVSGLSSMSPYGATVVVAVREELNERIAAIGGTTISVRGADYPVFDGFLFLPFRTPSGAPAATLSKSPRIRAVQELIEPSEEMFDFGDEPNRNLTPVIISYSTTADSGVESILAGLGHFAGAGKFDFHFQSRLL